MNLGFSLNDLFEMSKVAESDTPVLFSKTGEFNFELNPLKMSTQYNDKCVAYSEDGETLLGCPQNRPGRVRIHEGVKQIGPSAFAYGALTEIIMPDSLVAIGNGAFSGSSVQHITFGNGIKQIGGNYKTPKIDSNDKIEEAFDNLMDNYKDAINDDYDFQYGGVFNSCLGLSSVVIPDNVEIIGGSTFSGCKNLHTVSLPKNLKKIGNFAFQDCILENIVIPDTITYLGKLSLFGAISVILDGKVPSGLIKAITGTYRYNDEDYYGETDDSKKPNYTEVSYNGNKIFIPRCIKDDVINNIDKSFDASWFTSSNGHDLFSYGASASIKQDTAFAEYRHSKTSNAFSFMKKCGKEMAERYLNEKNQEKFVDFLKTGAVERKYLPDLLKQANQKEKTAAAAYIMQSLGQVPDDEEDDTFNL